MRKLVTWIVVTVGIAALVRKLRQRKAAGAEQVEAGDEDPADELRRKLADTREQPAAEARASQASVPVTPEATIDERRTEVHDQGRAAIDEMQQSTED